MKDLGQRIEFHVHSLFSDGILLPSEIIHMAKLKDYAAICITDHVDNSNLKSVVNSLSEFVREQEGRFEVPFIPGVEISYVEPDNFLKFAERARKLGARIIIAHGETVAENVPKGTNRAAVAGKGLIDILAHPGLISEEEVALAKASGIFLELTSRQGHNVSNGHVAQLAQKVGAKLIVSSDTHKPEDLIDQATAFMVARASGLSEAEALKVVKDNPKELYLRISSVKI